MREKYESTAGQLGLQDHDRHTRRTELAETREAAGGAAQPAKLGRIAKYVTDRKRSRWCRHLQRVCGTQQIWEVLADTGRFDVDLRRTAVQERDPDAEDEAAPPISAAARRKLHHTQAAAKAAYNQGVRLDRKRKNLCDSGATRFTVILTRHELGILEKHDSGQLRTVMNDAVTQFGHGRLVRDTGETRDIGGSTGGGSAHHR